MSIKEIIFLTLIIGILCVLGASIATVIKAVPKPESKIKVILRADIPESFQTLTVFTADGRTYATVVTGSGISLIELQNYKPVVEAQNSTK